jgi:hypothetical protein
MRINNKEVKAIRTITEEEYKQWVGDDNMYYGGGGRNIFVIDFVDGSTLLPRLDCINLMRIDKCMFSQIQFMP